MFAPMTSSLVDLLALNEFGGHSLRRVAPENTLEAVRQGTLHKIGQGGVVQHHGVKFVARLKAAHLAEESAAASEELSAQAQTLQKLVSQFSFKDEENA